METKLESAMFIYKASEIVGIIKRDDKSKKHIVYTIKEAKTEDIAALITEQKIISKSLDQKKLVMDKEL